MITESFSSGAQTVLAKYTQKSTSVTSFSGAAPAVEGTTYTLKNEYEPTVDIEVNKVWVPVNSWPENVESVTVQLQQSVNGATPTDVAGKTLTITADNSAANAETVDAAESDEAKAAQRALIAQRTFANLPKNDNAGNPITYSVVETAVSGTGVSKEDFIISYSTEGRTDSGLITITNTRKPGDLELSKKVAGEGSETNKEFSFTIKLTAPEGGSLADEYMVEKDITNPVDPAPSKEPARLNWTTATTTESGTETTTTNTNKEGTIGVTLTHNQTVTVKDLPAGTAYEITEDNYSADGYSASVTSGEASGSIIGGTTRKVAVEYTNNYSAGGLTVEKILSGNATDATKQFRFEVEFEKTGLSGNHGRYKIGTTDIIATTSEKAISFTDGKTKIEFTLKGGEKAEFINLPVGTTFTVKEVSADLDGYETTVATTGGTLGENKTVTGTISASASVTASYTNTRNTVNAEAAKLWKSGEQNIVWPEDVQKVEFTLFAAIDDAEAVAVNAENVAGLFTGIHLTGSLIWMSICRTADAVFPIIRPRTRSVPLWSVVRTGCSVIPPRVPEPVP